MRAFTHSELAKYDGREGRPGYIGVNGNVYDVSEVPEWEGAEVHGRDVTYQEAAQKYSPVSKLPLIGKLVD